MCYIALLFYNFISKNKKYIKIFPSAFISSSDSDQKYTTSLYRYIMENHILIFLSIISISASTAIAIMDCLKNRDCLNRHEHLCNMQNGMWTRNYVLYPKNGTSFEGMFPYVAYIARYLC